MLLLELEPSELAAAAAIPTLPLPPSSQPKPPTPVAAPVEPAKGRI